MTISPPVQHSLSPNHHPFSSSRILKLLKQLYLLPIHPFRNLHLLSLQFYPPIMIVKSLLLMTLLLTMAPPFVAAYSGKTLSPHPTYISPRLTRIIDETMKTVSAADRSNLLCIRRAPEHIENSRCFCPFSTSEVQRPCSVPNQLIVTVLTAIAY